MSQDQSLSAANFDLDPRRIQQQESTIKEEPEEENNKDEGKEGKGGEGKGNIVLRNEKVEDGKKE